MSHISNNDGKQGVYLGDQGGLQIILEASSSLSNIHFGHYKASTDSNYILEIHTLFTEIVVSTGYSPTRWQNCLSVMLDKTAGDCRPDKL
jgi:hypothetical protein